MSNVAQHQGVVKMDIASSSTATTDVSSGVVGFSLPLTKSIGKHFVLSSEWQKITEGGKSIAAKLKTEIDTSVSHIFSYLSNWAMSANSGSRTFDFYTPSSSTGSLYITGEWYIEAPDNLMIVEAGKGDAQIATWTLHSHGTISIAAAA